VTVATAKETSRDRLERLDRYLTLDPANLSLIADAAAAAFEAGEPQQVSRLIARYEELALLPATLLNLKGMAALADRRLADAEAAFLQIAALGELDPAVAFNLAWVRALKRDYEGALNILGDDAALAAPLGPKLKVQMLHHLGRLEEALACGKRLAERRPENQELMGALSLVAIDLEDMALAKTFAERGAESSDGLSTLGMLMLGENRTDGARDFLQRALAIDANNPRALVGRGLELFLQNEPTQAVQFIDKGAALFGDHLGSWIASGWVRFAGKDMAGARRSFERCVTIDGTFAEGHGGLAVIDILEGRVELGRREAETALRLDRNCLSGALAKTLLLARDGKPESAQRLRDTVLNRPFGPNGQSIAQSMVAFGLAPAKGTLLN
jgi:tetratricopeptide (TPR) repeat protein